jgi:glycosyltransferase involved in cell wall biosynthesis
LPCIASPNAGASFDLIKENETGFIVDFGDEKKVIEKINQLLDNPGEAKRMGKNAAEFIKDNAGIGVSVNGFLNALMPRENN